VTQNCNFYLVVAYSTKVLKFKQITTLIKIYSHRKLFLLIL